MSDQSTQLPRNTPLVNPGGQTVAEMAGYTPANDLKTQVLDVLKNIQINGQNGQMDNGNINFTIAPPTPKASETFHQLNPSHAPQVAHSSAPEVRHAPPKSDDGFDHVMSRPYAGAGQHEKPKPAPPEAGHPVPRSGFLENARTDRPDFPKGDASEGGRYEVNSHHPNRVLVDSDGHKIEKNPSRSNENDGTGSKHMDSLKSSMPVTFQIWYKGKIGKIMINCEQVPTER